MAYDFTTLIDRSAQGAEKWAMMKRRLPDVSTGTVPFSVADMEFVHPPELVEGLVDALRGDIILGYTGPGEAYLGAVAGWMRRRHGWAVDPAWVTVTGGVVPALFCAVDAYTKPGEGALLLTPVYYPFYNAARRQGRQVAACPLLEGEGGYRIDFDGLEALAARPENRLLLFCSPHNPVGRVWQPEELRRVAEICARHDVVLVADEIHHDLIMPGHRHTVLATLPEAAGCKLVTCTAPSKTFNLAGMQTANIIIADEELRRGFREAQARRGLGLVGALGYRACEIAYTRCEGWLEELLAVIWRNYEALSYFVARRMPKARVYPLEGSYLPWMDFRAYGLGGEALEALFVEKAHVFLDEGQLFGPEGDGFMRMNIACPTEVMLAGLERMAAALEGM